MLLWYKWCVMTWYVLTVGFATDDRRRFGVVPGQGKSLVPQNSVGGPGPVSCPRSSNSPGGYFRTFRVLHHHQQQQQHSFRLSLMLRRVLAFSICYFLHDEKEHNAFRNCFIVITITIVVIDRDTVDV